MDLAIKNQENIYRIDNFTSKRKIQIYKDLQACKAGNIIEEFLLEEEIAGPNWTIFNNNIYFRTKLNSTF